MIKDTDEYPDGRDAEGERRSGRVLSTGTSVRGELRSVTLPVLMCLPTWKLFKPPAIGILWRFLM